MTKEEIISKICTALEIDKSDIDEEATVGSFYDDVELDEVKDRLQDEFNVDLQMDLDTTINEMIEGLCAHFEVTE